MPIQMIKSVELYFISVAVSIALTQLLQGSWFEADWLPSDIVKYRGSLVANSMTSNDGMASRALEMTLRRRSIKIWILCQ